MAAKIKLDALPGYIDPLPPIATLILCSQELGTPFVCALKSRFLLLPRKNKLRLQIKDGSK